MQYLSKAYNYYSGINPATLSGAIDVIVVRSTDENGEDVLACSPFHVRFGKLRVLRATDKRVTVSLPNNLPEPHIAPFYMKVGETGEAFFVLETEDEVPADLMTSPVINAADAGEDETPRPSLDGRRPSDASEAENDPTSLTLEPFGATERQINHQGHHDRLASDAGTHGAELHPLPEVEPFDLNAAPGESGSLDTSVISDKDATPKKSTSTHKRSNSNEPSQNQPANPLVAAPGEDTTLPVRNYKLRNVHTEGAELELPKVKPGEHEGPEVKYGTDIVLDMDGFHRDAMSGKLPSVAKEEAVKQAREAAKKAEEAAIEEEEEALDAAESDAEKASVVPEPKTPDMPAARTMPTSPASPPRPKSPMLVKTAELESLVDDLMGGSESGRDLGVDLPAALESLNLESGNGARASPAGKARRGDRMQSEPPELERPSSPTTEYKAVNSQMDYAWDWGRIPEEGGEGARPAQHRSDSLPPGTEVGVAGVSGAATTTRATLRAVDNEPYVYLLELDGRAHIFELSLCGYDDYAPDCKADDQELEEFDSARVTYDRFMEDAAIVDDPKLVVYFDGLHMTWTTGYPLLLALALFRRSLPSRAPQKDAQPRPTSGYGWSRWFRRADTAPSVTTTASATSLPEAPSMDASPISTNGTEKTDVPVSPPTPPADDVASTFEGAPAEPAADAIHYAKTLRLSSDQLKQLNLKPGPNTVQFSVSASYSGFAVVTARIFLWEETDQVIISDIDGTITKSDALGHVFAAIGRDWTHVGIANLYTDICNNGYKILYLTARAIGQADTTREYLKTIVQGEYRMPEGPVIMSPDRLMASLHREVILRKPELFKMACLRDIQRLFASRAKDAFFAGFGNRITDAMSYRSVGIPTSKIYTIDSTGVLKTELLQSAHKGSYMGLNDLVNEMFPPVTSKFQPEFTDFNYWRDPIADIALPDLSPLAPPSPALSARSDASGNSRLSYLGGFMRRGSRAASPDATSQPGSPRPSSPLMGPVLSASDLSEGEEEEHNVTWSAAASSGTGSVSPSRSNSMPGSFEEGAAFPAEWLQREDSKADFRERHTHAGENGDDHGDEDEEDYDDDDIFDDDILATGEMARVPF